MLTRFVRARRGVYFEAAPGSRSEDDIRRFLEDTASQLGLGEAKISASDWLSAWNLAYSLAPKDRPFILCLDEFPWLAASAPDALSLLKRFWDRWHEEGRLLLVLCGSDSSALKRYFAGAAPLMGQRCQRSCRFDPLLAV
jgi:hypothetical protein